MWLSSDLAAEILAANEGTTLHTSLDLGLSAVDLVRHRGAVRWREVTLPLETLVDVSRFRHAIAEVDLMTGRILPLRVNLDGVLHKLVATRSAPTVMIAGIQMHRRVDPWADAQAKARRVIRGGEWVFDTCGGLGYTAAGALAMGAGLVLSTEPNPAVRLLREHNPWSPTSNLPGLVFHAVRAEALGSSLPDGIFDAVLHDPPRFSLAGSLYGGTFYALLRRVMRRRGTIYHYTGQPYSKRRGASFVKGVARRLSMAGFSVTWDEEASGLVGHAR